MSTEDTEKEYSGYLMVNWKDDDVRFRKTAPSDHRTSPYEIAVPVTMTVRVPSVPVPEIEAEIEIPPAQVENAVHEALPDDTEADDE